MSWLNELKLLPSGELEALQSELPYKLDYLKSNPDDFVFWIEGQPRGVFKEENKFSSVFTELFASHFAKRIHFPCVTVKPMRFTFTKPVSNKNKYTLSGLFSEDYIANRKKCETIEVKKLIKNRQAQDRLNIESMLEAVDKYASHYNRRGRNLVIDEHLRTNLYKLLIFDFMLLQGDRCSYNIEFMLDKTDKQNAKLQLSPVYDNSLTLFAYWIKNNHIIGALRNEQDVANRKDMLEEMIKKTRFELLANDKEMDFYGPYYKNLTEIGKEIAKNSELFHFVKEISKTSVEEVFDSIKDDNEYYTIPNRFVHSTKFAFNYQLNAMVEEAYKHFTPEQKTEFEKENAGLKDKRDYLSRISTHESTMQN